MAFIKRDVKDRVVQYPRRYQLVEVQPGIFDLIPVTGTVIEEGTPINKEYLQPIEDGISDLDENFQNIQTEVNSHGEQINNLDAEVVAHKADYTTQSKVLLRDILRIKMRQTGLNLDPNAWSDSFEDVSGINTTLSSNYTISSGKLLSTYTSDLCEGGTPIANGYNGTSTKKPESAFDNSTSSSWSSEEKGDERLGVSWIGYDFGVGNEKHIRRLRIYQGASGTDYNHMQKATLQKSNNGTSWQNVSVLTFSEKSKWESVIVPPSSPARYWRLLAHTSGNVGSSVGTWNVYELEFMGFEQATVVWNPQIAEGTLNKAVVEAIESLNSGTLEYYISRDGGTTFTRCYLDTVIDISSQPEGQSVVLKAILKDGAELLSIAWGGSV